ncbi:MAG: hypothetical protein AAB304_04860, partial [Pseudomonadota bacterium]
AVAVTLGVGQRPIHVKNEGGERHFQHKFNWLRLPILSSKWPISCCHIPCARAPLSDIDAR